MDKKQITIITGLSGAGKSTAIAVFEDAGFYCIDNLPVALLPKFLDLPLDEAEASDLVGLAFGMDLREKEFMTKFPAVYQQLKERGYRIDVLFLEADEQVLVRRFSQTRRHHPLSQTKSLLECIRTEKSHLKNLRERSDLIIDTSRTNIHELKSTLLKYIQKGARHASLRTQVLSFGYKKGIPPDADLIFDVRFLANPYFVPELKRFSGEDEAVRSFVLKDSTTRTFLEKCLDLLDYLMPLYEKEGKTYLTIAVGCTGGRHRSVVIAREIGEHLIHQGKKVQINHRDLED